MEFVRSVFDDWFAEAWPKYERRLAEWQAARVRTVSQLLGIEESAVGWAEIVWCHVEYGVPPLEDEAPRFSDMRMDARRRRAIGG